MLAHQFASTSSRKFTNIKPAGSFTRQRAPTHIVAAATLSPSKLNESQTANPPRPASSGPSSVFLSSTRAAAGQLWGVLKFFQAEEEAALGSETDSNVLQETANRAKEVRDQTLPKGYFVPNDNFMS